MEKRKRVYKMITEILDDIQKDVDNVESYLNNTTLKAVFQYNYDPEKKWLLPKEDPPYKPAPEPLGMTPTNFLQTVRTWSNWSREDIPKAKREGLFINTLEGIHESEAVLLLHIKNGTLTKLYPFATKKFGQKHGFLPKPETSKNAEESAEPVFDGNELI